MNSINAELASIHPYISRLGSPMKLRVILLALFSVFWVIPSQSQEMLGIAIERLLSKSNSENETNWNYVQNPPVNVLESAQGIYTLYIEGMREVDPVIVSNKLAKESTADFHDIIVIHSSEVNPYRIVWFYLWENSKCDTYDFNADIFTLTENGENPNIRVGPSIATGGTVCTRHSIHQVVM